MRRVNSLEKDPDAGKDWGQKEKGAKEDKMVGWHHRLDGYEFEQTLGDGDGQGSPVCCSPWGHRESDTTPWLNSNNTKHAQQRRWKSLHPQTKTSVNLGFIPAIPPSMLNNGAGRVYILRPKPASTYALYQQYHQTCSTMVLEEFTSLDEKQLSTCALYHVQKLTQDGAKIYNEKGNP